MLSFNEKEMKIFSENFLLSSIWTSAENSANEKIMILLHGGPEGTKEGPDDIFVKLAHELANIGIDTVRFDFQGQGQSEGDYVNTTMTSQRQDFEVIYNKAIGFGYKKIGMIGESFGASCALGVFNENRFSVLCLLWPCIYLLDNCFAFLFEDSNIQQLNDLGYIQVGEDRVGPNLLDELKNVDNFEKTIYDINVPTLLIHGEADEEVPYTQSIKAFNILKEPKKLVLVPEADHCLRRPQEQAIVLREVREWVLKYL